MTYCHVKLPVMPSFKRSRSERCRLGPEPIGGNVGLSLTDAAAPAEFRPVCIFRLFGPSDVIQTVGLLPRSASTDPEVPVAPGSLLVLKMPARCLSEFESREGDAMTLLRTVSFLENSKSEPRTWRAIWLVSRGIYLEQPRFIWYVKTRASDQPSFSPPRLKLFTLYKLRRTTWWQ